MARDPADAPLVMGHLNFSQEVTSYQMGIFRHEAIAARPETRRSTEESSGPTSRDDEIKLHGSRLKAFRIVLGSIIHL